MKKAIDTNVEKGSIECAEVKPYTTKQLAQLYNMSPRTLRRNLAAINKKIGAKRMGYFYNVEQVKMIFDHLTPPFQMVIILKPESSDNGPKKAA
jgi:hypothetical protein